MSVRGHRGSRRAINIWPGFVDALASLLLVVIFVLMVFMIAQYFLSAALTGRDETLVRLQREINGLAELLSLERTANAELRIDVSQLSSELQSSLTVRDTLANQIAALTESRDALQTSLDDTLTSQAQVSKELEDAYKVIDADKEKIEAQLAQLAILQKLRDEFGARIKVLEADTTKVNKELVDAYKVIEADKAKIQAQLQDLAILQSLHDDLIAKLAAADSARGKQEALTDEAQTQALLLNRQVAALREQLARIVNLLAEAEAKNLADNVQIADLGRRLNVALANKVQELARYRSEFFGRLREVLGNRQDIRIVGDRFVFQSEVLFASGSAELGAPGQQQMAQLAQTLVQIARKIPKDIPWILRVDGHTDTAPIHTTEFPSNWDLSTARAVSVVQFLIGQGIPADRLAATGFGEFQPLESGLGTEAFRRNRRIELKLTER